MENLWTSPFVVGKSSYIIHWPWLPPKLCNNQRLAYPQSHITCPWPILDTLQKSRFRHLVNFYTIPLMPKRLKDEFLPMQYWPNMIPIQSHFITMFHSFSHGFPMVFPIFPWFFSCSQRESSPIGPAPARTVPIGPSCRPARTATTSRRTGRCFRPPPAAVGIQWMKTAHL